MSNAYMELVRHSIHRRHMIAAGVAVAFSAVVHLLAIAWLLMTPHAIPFLAFHRPQQMPRFEAMRVRDVAPETWARELESLMAVAPPELISQPDVAEQTAALGVAPSAAAMEAPAADDMANLIPPARVQEPASIEPPTPWQPRQEILALTEMTVSETIPDLDRLLIPDVQRRPDAPDVLPPVDAALTELESAAPVAVAGPGAVPGTVDIAALVTSPMAPTPVVAAETIAPAEVIADAPELLSEKPEDVSPHRPLENFLKTKIAIHAPRRGDYAYFRLEVSRVGDDVLPVIPKDIIFLQDCSASMSEQRLYFCRKGLTELLGMLAPDDRFNVVKFRDNAEFCFQDWADNNKTNRDRATTFIASMRSEGATDIFTSMRPVLELETLPGRPVVAILITDGRATTGIVDASDIIGRFSAANDGKVSIFSFGTLPTANQYLLDLISYCNRGDARLTRGGRWGIAESLNDLMREVAHPVLTDVGFVFPSRADVYVYPVQTMNLYRDRPLILYGRMPKSASHLTFQAKGNAGAATGDMVFHVDLAAETAKGDDEIEATWARQKIYHLMGRYTQTEDPDVLQEIKQTARRYRIKIPHRKAL